MSTPPQPNYPPRANLSKGTPTAGGGPHRVTNKTRHGGGFNPSLNPTLNITVPGNGGGGRHAQDGGTEHGHSSKGTPGADFMSNEDIRAFCEHLRKDYRNRATERAMDADHLEAVLRTIPDSAGSRTGSRARARRVSRWLKKIAAAEKASQKYAAMLYGTFEREYEAQLRTIAPGRPRQNQRAPFAWR